MEQRELQRILQALPGIRLLTTDVAVTTDTIRRLSSTSIGGDLCPRMETIDIVLDVDAEVDVVTNMLLSRSNDSPEFCAYLNLAKLRSSAVDALRLKREIIKNSRICMTLR